MHTIRWLSRIIPVRRHIIVIVVGTEHSIDRIASTARAPPCHIDRPRLARLGFLCLRIGACPIGHFKPIRNNGYLGVSQLGLYGYE